MMISI